MDLFIDRAGRRPGLCAQLYEQIREGITAGRLRAGDQHADGEVTETVSTATQREVYLAWYREHDVRPDDQILGATQTGGNHD